LGASLLRAWALALLLFLIAWQAGNFARAQNARMVIVLGVSLAAVQFVSPGGVIVAAIVAPVLATFHVPQNGRNAGILVLLLFIPVGTALLLSYLARETHFIPAAWLSGPFDRVLAPRIFDPLNAARNGVLDAAAMIAMAFPVWLMAARFPAARVIAIVTSSLIAAVGVAAFLGRSRALGAFAPSLAALSLLSLTEFQNGPLRAQRAVAISTTSVVLSWLLLAF
jgi:hypothetical protein